jgi:hypothetical protein
MMNSLLVRHPFPLHVIRRPVRIEPKSESEMFGAMHTHPWVSAWGHESTTRWASTILGEDIRPHKERPALVLDSHGLPSLDGASFKECWFLSPELPPCFRSETGEVVRADQIRGWHVLKITYSRPELVKTRRSAPLSKHTF